MLLLRGQVSEQAAEVSSPTHAMPARKEQANLATTSTLYWTFLGWKHHKDKGKGGRKSKMGRYFSQQNTMGRGFRGTLQKYSASYRTWGAREACKDWHTPATPALRRQRQGHLWVQDWPSLYSKFQPGIYSKTPLNRQTDNITQHIHKGQRKIEERLSGHKHLNLNLVIWVTKLVLLIWLFITKCLL